MICFLCDQLICGHLKVPKCKEHDTTQYEYCFQSGVEISLYIYVSDQRQVERGTVMLFVMGLNGPV